jgi:hypothetical protein
VDEPRHAAWRRWVWIVLASLAFAGCRCGDDGLGGLEAVLDAPEAVDLGGVIVGERGRADVILASRGTGAVHVSALTLTGPDADAFRLNAPPMPLRIDVGQSVTVEVVFEPSTAGAHEAILVVHGPQADVELHVRLAGTGRVPGVVLCAEDACAVDGEPVTVDLGAVAPGQIGTGVFRIENRGDARLRLGGLSPSEGTLAAGFRILSDVERATIAPGARVDVDVALVGIEQGAVEGALVLTSDDPAHPQVRIDLVGEGLAASAPVACAAVSAVLHPDGTQTSFDPAEVARARPGDRVVLTAHPYPDCSNADGGRPLTYRWRLLEAPESSGARIVNGSSGPAPGLAEPPPWFAVDAVGVYIVGLEVSDGVRDSVPVERVIDARPEDDLTVELTWTVPADLDLHLVAPGGAAFCSPLDCFWDTCIGEAGTGIPLLDWGADTSGDGRLEPDGRSATNPVLVFDNEGDHVVDEETGIRLETIRLQVAPTVPGAHYGIGVHYFADRGVTAGAFRATVRVFHRGDTLIETEWTFESDAVGTFWEAVHVTADTFVATATTATESVSDYTAPRPCP